jgi:predicted dithiol-disulfide oxidoreductase (DUF899 family)
MLHDVRFPGESDAYRQARDDLLQAELELRRRIEAVAAQRRALPTGGEVPTDYVFDEWDADVGAVRRVRLSELFQDGKSQLFIYSFMFRPGARGVPLEVPCPVCTSIIDAIDGAGPHIEQHINFAVVTKAPIERVGAHARARGWRNVRLLSSAETSFNSDYRTEAANGEQFAMATTFVRQNGKIHHSWSSELWFVPSEPGQHPRHVDFMWPMWSILDRTPAGRGTGPMPQLRYSSAPSRG